MLAALAGLVALTAAAGQASAQVGLDAQLTSDYRLRGYSLSRREPAASLSLSYDDRGGMFAELNGIVLHRPDGGLGLLGGYATLGYAQRVGGDWSGDIGVLRAQYAPESSFGRNASYTELFAGATGRNMAFRLALSPDYLWDRTVTIYGSGELFQRLGDRWRVVGHFGLLQFLKGGPVVPVSRLQYDWTVQLKRELGHAELGVALNGGGPDPDYFGGAEHSKTAVTATARWTF